MIRISRENIYFLPFLIFFFFFYSCFLLSSLWLKLCCCITNVWHQLITCRQTTKYQICKTCLYRKSHGLIGPSFSARTGWIPWFQYFTHHTGSSIASIFCVWKLSGLFSLSLFTSQNGCELWMAVVFHLVSPFDLFSLATRDFSCCAVRDLFAFRSML